MTFWYTIELVDSNIMSTINTNNMTDSSSEIILQETSASAIDGPIVITLCVLALVALISIVTVVLVGCCRSRREGTVAPFPLLTPARSNIPRKYPEPIIVATTVHSDV
jgi:hypothetical protein